MYVIIFSSFMDIVSGSFTGGVRMSTNDFEECWGKGVSQDDDMSMFIDSEDESKGDTEEEQKVETTCFGDDEDTGTFFKFKEKIEVTNGLEDDGWLYQDDKDDETEETVEKSSDEKVFDDDDLTDDWDDEEITDDTDEEPEECEEDSEGDDGESPSEIFSRLLVDDTGNTCYESKKQKNARHESAIATYMNLVRKNLSKEEAINILYGEGSITDCLVRLFGEAVIREVMSD